MKLRKITLRLIIAALLLSGAAICTHAQSGPSVKRNTRDQQPAQQQQPASKQNTRQTPVTQDKGQDKQEASSSSSLVQASLKDEAAATQFLYEFKQPDFYINHILIEHDGSGRGRISFERRDSSEVITEPLQLSEAARKRINALWETLHFLDSGKSYQSEKQFPHLGTMRLQVKRDGREHTAEFNWTNDKDAAALVDEYKHLSEQAIFIFDINLARENQPLEAPKIMDRLEALLKRGELSDPQQLVPLLRDLSTDERIPLMARNQAGRLLKKIEK